MTNFSKKKFRGYCQVWDVIADRLDPYGLSLYRFIKSVASINDGKPIDFSIRQIMRATKMSNTKVQKAFRCLEEHKVIEVLPGGKYRNSRSYNLRDDEVAQLLDPKMVYNIQRHRIWTKPQRAQL